MPDNQNDPSSTKPRALNVITPALIIGLALLITTVATAAMGRRWWCACGEFKLFNPDAFGPHNSQHLLDPYSFSHLLHGLIFYGVLTWLLPRSTFALRLAWSTVIECCWEVLENSPWVIDRYRDTTAALGYQGDTIVNIWGDALSCAFGVWLAARLGLWRSIALFVVVELTLLWWIRDNLTLNVVMLLWPIPAVRTWQTGA